MMRAPRRPGHVILAIALAYTAFELAFAGARPLRARSSALQAGSSKITPSGQFTGKVVQVHPLSVDIEFENGDNSFLGNLHIAQMGLENSCTAAKDAYAIGDSVTAFVIGKRKRNSGMVQMTKIASRFDGKRLLSDFSTGDKVTGRFLRHYKKWAFFDVGAVVDAALNTETHDYSTGDPKKWSKGNIVELNVTKVNDLRIDVGAWPDFSNNLSPSDIEAFLRIPSPSLPS
mmetsp:Transcript_74092/g.131002  ORF Transcript_74092/g.131002 Transcript_74092/m.131002 type:complete len:230 (+) Transcript_74092:64-753(+)